MDYVDDQAEEQLDDSKGDDSDSDGVMAGESTADCAGSGTGRRVKVLLDIVLQDSHFSFSLGHKPLYWLERHTKLCWLNDQLTLYREPLVQAPIT
jgi:hypothetical protein